MINELYQEVILDHNKQPRNYHEMPDASCKLEGFNPLCGDRLTVFLKMEGDVVKDVSFVGSGCAISKASSSIMTTVVKGKTKQEIENVFQKFHDMVTGKAEGASGFAGASESLETSGGGAEGMRSNPPVEAKLQVFSGVSEFPARVKCASLAWHTMKAALEGKGDSVSTE